MPIDLDLCEDDVRDAITKHLRDKDFVGVFCIVWNGDGSTILTGPPGPPGHLKAMAKFLREVADDYETAEQ